jgi:hypothetical protein
MFFLAGARLFVPRHLLLRYLRAIARLRAARGSKAVMVCAMRFSRWANRRRRVRWKLNEIEKERAARRRRLAALKRER